MTSSQGSSSLTKTLGKIEFFKLLQGFSQLLKYLRHVLMECFQFIKFNFVFSMKNTQKSATENSKNIFCQNIFFSECQSPRKENQKSIKLGGVFPYSFILSTNKVMKSVSSIILRWLIARRFSLYNTNYDTFSPGLTNKMLSSLIEIFMEINGILMFVKCEIVFDWSGSDYKRGSSA